MLEQRYHATTQNWFQPGMSNINKNITVGAKLISPPTYNIRCELYLHVYGIYSYVPTFALYVQFKFRCQLQIFRRQKLMQVDLRQADTAA